MDGPRVFGLPPGADFPAEVANGILDRVAGLPPETLGRVEIFVNSARMQRRMTALFRNGPARLLPRVRLLTALGTETPVPDLPPAISPLARRLELTRLVAQLLEQERDLAPRTAAFDLADSLAALMDEMQGEGVSPDVLDTLDVTDESGHWARSLGFIRIVQQYFGDESVPDPEARQRRAVEHLVQRWSAAPPQHPVIVAGSTGSRGATGLFMRAVATLPQGALVLPGFDFDLPRPIWNRLDDPLTSEDHPQYRFAKLLADLGADPDDVIDWGPPAPVPERNRLVSLSLRPAPVTDQWMSEGRELHDLREPTEGMTLIEAASPRQEALSIALILRQAAEEGRTAALITPDRMLTRRVTAALDRWRLEPDDSAGRPLALSAPGRLLRHVAELFGERLTSEALLTLLKHPLVHSGAERGPHLRWTRELELRLRRRGPAFPDRDSLIAFATQREDAECLAWASWLSDIVDMLATAETTPLSGHLDRHIATTERLAAGPSGTGSGTLWDEAAGRKAAEQLGDLRDQAEHGGVMGLKDYRAVFDGILARAEVRDPFSPHPGIMIWGTLEARVQGADLVILGGLNDGTWPDLPPPDPWLNRRMRKEAGLLLPERQIGLAAHDFQQAVAAPEVVLTRAARDAEAETVVSRWLNRLSNLLAGLPQQHGPEALSAMRARGARWLRLAETDEANYAPVAPAPRPAPRPPVTVRPRQLSVTRIETLIRDPYDIYAREILNLRALRPLRQEPDAPLRGTVVHAIFERFVKERPDPADPAARDTLLRITDEVLAAEVPWPTARALWRARLARVADPFLRDEVVRQSEGDPLLVEERGVWEVPGTELTLTGQADRIDRLTDARLAIYDYKTGAVPSKKQIAHFDKQLMLEALMAEAGAFPGIDPAEVARVAHIGLGSSPKQQTIDLRDPENDDIETDPAKVLAEFQALINAFARHDQGYAARRAVESRAWGGDYDHLARFGEWTDSDDVTSEIVG
ncbi:double-strand break repair protein AddB [Tranquillimonas rosea]|uniref:double-strand break repair protein AddB n=1 Tax=Tranquillimonas rosea TaxID=641238 RepID=UPI003BAA6BA6